jgi:DNA-binding transcriptional MerR regulator
MATDCSDITDRSCRSFTPRELADALGISEQTVKAYEEKGLISSPTEKTAEQDTGYSLFDFIRLKIVVRSLEAGYSLSEVRELIGSANGFTSNHMGNIDRIIQHAHDKRYNISHRRSISKDRLERVNLRCDEVLLKDYIRELESAKTGSPESEFQMSTPLKQSTDDPALLQDFETDTKLHTVVGKMDPGAQPSNQPDATSEPLAADLDEALKLESKKALDAVPPPRAEPRLEETDAAPEEDPPKKITRVESAKQKPESESGNQQIGEHDDPAAKKLPGQSKTNTHPSPTKNRKKLGTLDFQGYREYIESFLRNSKIIQNLTSKLGIHFQRESVWTKFAYIVILFTFVAIIISFISQSSPPDLERALKSDSQTNHAADTQNRPSPVAKEPLETPMIPADTKPNTPLLTEKTLSAAETTLDSDDKKPLEEITLTEIGADESVQTDQAQQSPIIMVKDFSAIFEAKKKILRLRMQLVNIHPDSKTIRGHVFAVLKSGPESNAQEIVIPKVPLENGQPTRISKGASFSIAKLKIQYLKTILNSRHNQYNSATILIYSNTGELLLSKDFELTIRDIKA